MCVNNSIQFERQRYENDREAFPGMTVFTKTYTAPPLINRREILRYAGVRGRAPELEALLEECIAESEGTLAYKVCWREFPVRRREGVLDLGFAETSSAALGRNLDGCGSVVLFAATVGLGMDRRIARYSSLSPTKAVLLQALGTERIEALCDVFNEEVTREQAVMGRETRPRFSPGYGDLPLAMQREIFAVLDCPRKIGLSLNENLLMSPSKSVTALIGVTAGGDIEKTD